MAQNTWINIAGDKAAATKKDGDENHTVSGGAAAAGDFTVSYDSAVVTTLHVYDTMARAARARVVSSGLK